LIVAEGSETLCHCFAVVFPGRDANSRDEIGVASPMDTPPGPKGKSKVSKQILVDALKKGGLKASDAASAVDTVVASIGKELKKSQKFGIPGFGSFHVSKRAARMGRNPRTGEAIKIKASKGVRFKAGAKLKAGL
jgi:DNA-binding protein HU-beta